MAGSSEKKINITLKVWRQKSAKEAGQFVTYEMKEVSTDASFLEMLDQLNEKLIVKAKSPLSSITIVVKEFVEVVAL